MSSTNDSTTKITTIIPDFETFAFDGKPPLVIATRPPRRAASLKKQSFKEEEEDENDNDEVDSGDNDVEFNDDSTTTTKKKQRKTSSMTKINRTRSLLTDGDDGDDDDDEEEVAATATTTTTTKKRKSISKSTSSLAAERAPGEIKYWLMKAEPEDLSVEKLKSLPEQTSSWEGVRNFVARNNLKAMRDGDLCLFYQSCVKIPFVPAILRVVKEASADETQFDAKSCYYDEKSTRVEPRWFLVHVKLHRELRSPITRDDMKADEILKELEMFRLNRLSVSKVTLSQFNRIIEIADKQK